MRVLGRTRVELRESSLGALEEYLIPRTTVTCSQDVPTWIGATGSRSETELLE